MPSRHTLHLQHWRGPLQDQGHCVWDLFPQAVGTKFHEGYLRAVRTGQKVSFEEHCPAPLDLWLECHCYPGPDGLTVYFHDVSARRRAEDSVRRSTALLRAISDGSSDVIYAKDRDGRMTFANPAALALIGLTGDEVAGHTDAELLEDPAAAREVMDNDRRVMDEGVAAEFEERVQLPDGTERIWLSHKAPYRDEQGRVIGLLGISRDITERQRAAMSDLALPDEPGTRWRAACAPTRPMHRHGSSR